MATLISKISVSKVFGAIKAPKEKTSIMQVIGIATSCKTGQSQYGEYIEFAGDFEAINLITGETFRSSKCFLPGAVPEMVAVALAKGKEVEGFSGLQFAFSIAVSPSQNPIGYEYQVTPLVENKEADPLAALRDAVSMTPKIENKSQTKSKE